MLECIAKEPLPLKDQILQADDETIVKMVGKADANQKLWFRGLLTNRVLSNKIVLKCIDQYYKLCEMQDVQRLLALNIDAKDDEMRRLIVKCASTLDEAELAMVILRHFAKIGFANMLENSATNEQLILLLNKMQQNNSTDKEFIKNILLLFLQNPMHVLVSLYGECVKNTVYTTFLHHLFDVLKNTLSINSMGLNALSESLERYPVSNQNMQQYSHLLKLLLETECINYDKLMVTLIVPNLQTACREENFQTIEPIVNLCNVSKIQTENAFLVY